MIFQRYRWALVTGASAGIGREFALQLASKGMDLVLVARNEERLSQVANIIQTQYKRSVVIHSADLSNFDSVKELYEKIYNFRVDILVNNAGFGMYGDFLELEVDKLMNMIELNIKTLTFLSHKFGNQMKERRQGGIINIASTAAYLPIPHFNVYAATKSYVYSLSMSLWAELKEHNVHVMCVSPGPTETMFFDRAGMKRNSMRMMSSQKVVEGALKAFEKGKPVYVPGVGNKLIYSVVRRIFPDKFIAELLEKNF